MAKKKKLDDIEALEGPFEFQEEMRVDTPKANAKKWVCLLNIMGDGGVIYKKGDEFPESKVTDELIKMGALSKV